MKNENTSTSQKSNSKSGIIHRPLLNISIFFGCGILLEDWLQYNKPNLFNILLFSSSMFLLTIVTTIIFKCEEKFKQITFFMLCLLSTLSAMYLHSYKMEELRRAKEIPIISGQPIEIVGVVKNPPLILRDELDFDDYEIQKYLRKTSYMFPLVLKDCKIVYEDKRIDIPGKVNVYIYCDPPELKDIKIGTNLKLNGIIKGISSEEHYVSKRKGQYFSIALKNNRDIMILNHSNEELNILEQNVFIVRKEFLNFINRTFLGDSRSFISAIIVGEKSGISKEMSEDFLNSGAMHILAISGLHIMILCWTVNYLTRKLFLAKLSIASIISLIVIWLYVIISGSSESAVRAAIMISIYLITLILYIPSEAITSLCFAFLFLLVLDTNNLFKIGFQLSFIATFGILSCAPVFIKFRQKSEDVISKEKKKVIRYIEQIGDSTKNTIIISLIAWVFTIPLVMYYFKTLSIIGIFASVVVMPLLIVILFLSLLLIPIGVIFSIDILSLPINFFSWCLIEANKFFADLPYGHFKLPAPQVWSIILYFAILVAMVIIFRTFNIKKRWVLIMLLPFALLILTAI